MAHVFRKMLRHEVAGGVFRRDGGVQLYGSVRLITGKILVKQGGLPHKRKSLFPQGGLVSGRLAVGRKMTAEPARRPGPVENHRHV